VLPASPADEVPGVAAVRGRRAGQPVIEVGLAACAQGLVAGLQPVEQGDRGADPAHHDVVLLVSNGPAAVAAAETAQQVPGRVAAQDLPLRGVAAAVDHLAGEAFQAGHLLIAGRQRPGCDQHAAQVREDRGLLQAVKLAVAEIAFAGCDAGQDGRDGRLAEPAQRGSRRAGGPKRLPERAQRGADAVVRAGQQAAQPQFQLAAGALARPRAVRAGRAVGERRDGAVPAPRFGQRARADWPDLAAAGAACEQLSDHFPSMCSTFSRQAGPGHSGSLAGRTLPSTTPTRLANVASPCPSRRAGSAT